MHFQELDFSLTSKSTKTTYKINSWSKGEKNLPMLLFLHGFPTSSRDFSPLIMHLSKKYFLVGFDFLGFGRSQKHKLPKLSIHLQADLAQFVIASYGMKNPIIIAHDYGLSVAQELLARKIDFQKMLLMNGGAYSHLHRPLLIQKLLLIPVLGFIIAKFGSRKLFNKNMQRLMFGPVAPELLDEAWQDIERENGHKIFHQLIHYITDRRQHAARWAQSLEDNQHRLFFFWGEKDPISGLHMLTQLKKSLPRATFKSVLVGHYPQWEATGELLHFCDSVL